MIKVLIVEDDPMVAQINREYIERVSGFRVIGSVENGLSALEFMEKNPGIHLVILDVYMPKMDGVEMLEEIRRRFDDVDVIFVTAAKEKRVIQRGLQLGAVDYLIKPFTFERIRQALEKYKMRYELLHTAEGVDQRELDKLFGNAAGQQSGEAAPKGIHPLTLEKIRKYIAKSDAWELDLKTMGEHLSVSTVTLRTYLDYLEERREVEKEIRYGGIGRPSYVYRKRK